MKNGRFLISAISLKILKEGLSVEVVLSGVLWQFLVWDEFIELGCIVKTLMLGVCTDKATCSGILC